MANVTNPAKGCAKHKFETELQRLDTNGDGVISREEFVAAGGSQSVFDRFDWDANGTLDRDELEAVLTKKHTLVVSRAFEKNRLSKFDFQLGLTNMVVKIFMIGAYPAYYIVYMMLQFPIMLFVVSRKWFSPPRYGGLWFLEFCWVANMTGWLYSVMAGLASLTGVELFNHDIQRFAWHLLFSVANGPLIVAAIMLKNAIVFHDPVRVSGFVIHASPAIASWCIQWKRQEFIAAWPGMFGFDEQGVDASLDYRAFFLMYFSWWTVYGLWLLWIGCEMPDRGWGDSSLRDMQPAIIKTFGVTGLRAQAVVYLVGHAVACSLTHLVAQLVYVSFALHTALLAFVTLGAIHQGSRYYHHAFGKKIEMQICDEMCSLCCSLPNASSKKEQ